MAASTQVTIYQTRTTDHTFALYQSDGVTGLVLAASDVVRFKLGRGDGATPDLDLDSAAATANGSVVTIDDLTAPADVTVRFAQADISGLHPGVYRGEILVVDDSETDPADAIKYNQLVVVHVIGTLGGDTGLT